jgi:flagellar assembly protein FliH
MDVKRFSFKELGDGIELEAIAANPRIFMPAGTGREGPIPPPPPPPSFSEEEVKAAERDGYKKGFLEGQTDGRKQAEREQADIEVKLLAMLEHYTNSIAPLFAHYRDMALQLQENMPKVALAVARKVAGDALAENAHIVITDIAAKACETMMNEPKLTITVRESMGDILEQKLQQIASRLPAATDIIIMRDPDMPAEDCRIEWKQGGMERNTGQMWQQLERVIGNLSATALRDGKEEMDELKNELGTQEPPQQPSEKE